MAMAAASDIRKSDPLRLWLDIADRLLVIGLYGAFAIGVIGSVLNGSSWFNTLMLFQETVVVVVVLTRRAAVELSVKPLDWFLAVAATVGPLLARPGHVHALTPPATAGVILLLGVLCQLYCTLTLRRSFGIAPANRGLVVAGPYRVVRHPIYASYLLSWVGFLLLNPTWWNAGVLGVSLALQILRIEAEERLLSQDDAHAAFAETTRHRLIPGLY